MKAVLLENVLYKGQRYKAGQELNLDAVTAGMFERSGIAHIETPPKPVENPPALPSAEKKTRSTGRKTSAAKKSTRGQK